MRLQECLFRRIMVVVAVCTPFMSCAQEIKRSIQLTEPGLNDKWFAVELKQSDFQQGTRRITQPGYYYLSEDIIFDPSGSPSDPLIGCIAALTIEVSNVIVDLNQHSIKASQTVLDNDLAGVYCPIRLNNFCVASLQQGKTFLPVFAFQDATEPVYPENITIRNGTLATGRAGLIEGIGNKNVRCYDLVARDFERNGISLIDCTGVDIKRCCIFGNEHTVPCSTKAAVAKTIQVLLENGGISGADSYITALDTFIADEKASFVATDKVDGDVTGIRLPVVEQERNCCVCISDVTICNLQAAPQETVGIGVQGEETILFDSVHALDWRDVFSGGGGSFAPNALVQAQAFYLQQTGAVTGNALAIVNALVTPDETAFTQKAEPRFGLNSQGNTSYGVNGMFLCVECAKLDANSVCSCLNCGDAGLLLNDISSGLMYGFVEPKLYQGAHAVGMHLFLSKGVTISHSAVKDLTSVYGSALGYLFVDAQAHKVSDCIASDFEIREDVEFFTDLPTVQRSLATNTTEAIGFLVTVENAASRSNEFVNCRVCQLYAPRKAFGFHVQRGINTVFKECDVRNIAVRALENLAPLDIEHAKLGAGFLSRLSDCTLCVDCCVADVRAENEGMVGGSMSRVSGFALLGSTMESDRYPMVVRCSSWCNNGGAGVASGIGLGNTQCALILENKVADHQAQEGGFGFGIIDIKPGQTDSIILKNCAFNNQTANYVVPFDAPNTLPLSTGTNVQVNYLNCRNPWNNVLIEKDPGTQQVEPECKVLLSSFEKCLCH